MRDAIRVVWYGLCGLIAITIIMFFFQGSDFFLYKMFAPKYEQVRRNTFEQSQAYNEGMRRDLENIRNQYLAEKDPAAKAALKATFVHRAEGYPNELPADLQSFYQSIR